MSNRNLNSVDFREWINENLTFRRFEEANYILKQRYPFLKLEQDLNNDSYTIKQENGKEIWL